MNSKFLIMMMVMIAIAYPGQAAILEQQTALSYVTPMKLILTPSNCKNTGSGGCGYLHRTDPDFVGRSIAYPYTRIGKMITVSDQWSYVQAIEITEAVTNNTYPMVVTISKATTADPNTATITLINTWYLYKNCEVNQSGCASIIKLNLDSSEDVTNEAGAIIIPYLFIEILNPVSGAIGVMPKVGISTTTKTGIGLFIKNTYYSDTWVETTTQDWSGNMVYPAYTNYYGYNFPANPTDTRIYIKDIQYKIYGQFIFPSTPDPTPSITSTQPVTTSTMPADTPPAPGGIGIIISPDFNNGTIICPDCGGNETQEGTDEIGEDTGIGGTMKGLGYCKSGGCSSQDFIDMAYDFSNMIFILSIMFIMVKMFRYRRTTKKWRA